MRIQRVAVIGLDCCEPSLVFDRWRDDLPNLRRLMQSGLYGNLESCLPPITVPAWTCMTTGKDPGCARPPTFARPSGRFGPTRNDVASTRVPP